MQNGKDRVRTSSCEGVVLGWRIKSGERASQNVATSVTTVKKISVSPVQNPQNTKLEWRSGAATLAVGFKGREGLPLGRRRSSYPFQSKYFLRVLRGDIRAHLLGCGCAGWVSVRRAVRGSNLT